MFFFWRRGRDSNPCGLSPKRFSRPPRYDRFDTSPNYMPERLRSGPRSPSGERIRFGTFAAGEIPLRIIYRRGREAILGHRQVSEYASKHSSQAKYLSVQRNHYTIFHPVCQERKAKIHAVRCSVTIDVRLHACGKNIRLTIAFFENVVYYVSNKNAVCGKNII